MIVLKKNQERSMTLLMHIACQKNLNNIILKNHLIKNLQNGKNY